MLATRISFMNQIAYLCEKTGADMKETAAKMGTKYKNDAYYYVAGNTGYVTAVKTILENAGVDTKQIKFDKFTGY